MCIWKSLAHTRFSNLYNSNVIRVLGTAFHDEVSKWKTMIISSNVGTNKWANMIHVQLLFCKCRHVESCYHSEALQIWTKWIANVYLASGFKCYFCCWRTQLRRPSFNAVRYLHGENLYSSHVFLFCLFLYSDWLLLCSKRILQQASPLTAYIKFGSFFEFQR